MSLIAFSLWSMIGPHLRPSLKVSVSKGNVGKILTRKKRLRNMKALGASSAESNPLEAFAFREEDIYKCVGPKMSKLTRSNSRLSVYSVTLSDLLLRADGIGHYTREPSAYSVSCACDFGIYMLSQASRAPVSVFRERS